MRKEGGEVVRIREEVQWGNELANCRNREKIGQNVARENE